MKKLTKIGSMLLATAMTVSAAFAFTACKPKKKDTDQTLEVFAVNKGYNVTWIQKTLDAFKEEEWVKEKYPNLYIETLGVATSADKAGALITAGPKSTTADLIFSTYTQSDKYNTPYKSGYYFEDLTDVYNGNVPGESVTLKSKLYGDQDSMYKFTLERGSRKGQEAYFGMPGVNGWMGFLLNRDYLRNLGISAELSDLPKTTDEFVAFCKAIVGKGGYAFSSANQNYLVSQFPVWWVQYEGVEGYEKFFNLESFDGSTKNAEQFMQEGRLEALEVMNSLVNYRNEGFFPTTNYGEDYVTAQKKFFDGNYSAMMYNGDWLESENFKANKATDQDMILLQNPVISAIVDKYPESFSFRYDDTSINWEDMGDGETDYTQLVNKTLAAKADAQLAKLVALIDEGKTYADAKTEYDAFIASNYAGETYNGAALALSEAAYNAVEYARHLEYRLEGEAFFIPSYANGKEVAKDYLRFLATDKGIAIVQNETKTLSPFKLNIEYDYEQDGTTIKTETRTMSGKQVKYFVTTNDTMKYVSTMQKSRMDMAAKANQVPGWESFQSYRNNSLRVMPSTDVEGYFMNDTTKTHTGMSAYTKEIVYANNNIASWIKAIWG